MWVSVRDHEIRILRAGIQDDMIIRLDTMSHQPPHCTIQREHHCAVVLHVPYDGDETARARSTPYDHGRTGNELIRHVEPGQISQACITDIRLDVPLPCIAEQFDVVGCIEHWSSGDWAAAEAAAQVYEL